MTHDEMIAVIAAHKAGKTIEVKKRRDVGYFVDCGKHDDWSFPCNSSGPMFNFGLYEYRVAPEPLELWINEYPVGTGKVCNGYDSKYKADEMAHPSRVRCVHVREVME